MISKREFESHGMPHIKALDALVSMNWLVRDQETKKLLLPTDLLYKDPDGEKEKVKCYLLNLTIAQAIGFKDNYVKNI